MPSSLPPLADSRNTFEDLSGVDIAAYANPYDALLSACKDDPAEIQARYSTHRTTRNAQQKQKLLSSEFSGLILDPILQRLEDPTIEPGFTDPRHCLVFWARPPSHIRSLVDKLQQELLTLAPKLWLMPLLNLHLTALEITHSLTQKQINDIIRNLGSSTIEEMTNYTATHRARLIKPMISYDGAALALSFLPAAGESLPSQSHPHSSSSSVTNGTQQTSSSPRTKQHDAFTYHHLRRSLFALASQTPAVKVDSRYVVPSSHITIGRFLSQEDHDTPAKMARWIAKIEELNAWLEREFWPVDVDVSAAIAVDDVEAAAAISVNGAVEKGQRNEQLEWQVGMEKGLDCREGTLWYGGGRTVHLGKGF